MSSPTLLPVTDASFPEEVLRAAGPVLLKIEADWCGPCQAMKPAIAEIAEQYAGRLTVATLDVDQSGQTAQQLGVRGVPTLMLFKDGQVIAQRVGLAGKADLVKLIDEKLQ